MTLIVPKIATPVLPLGSISYPVQMLRRWNIETAQMLLYGLMQTFKHNFVTLTLTVEVAPENPAIQIIRIDIFDNPNGKTGLKAVDLFEAVKKCAREKAHYIGSFDEPRQTSAYAQGLE